MRILRGTNGSALIELSLIAPILIIMLLGVVDLGMVLRGYIAVADSARAGAEYGLVSGHEADTSGWASAATYSSGSNIPNYLATARVFCTCNVGGPTYPCSAICLGHLAQYAEVTTTAKLPLVFNVRGLPANFTIKSVARIRVKYTSGV